MIEKVKLDIDIIFGFDNEKKTSIDFAKIGILFILQTKSSLYTSAFVFSTISKILETTFFELFHKNVET